METARTKPTDPHRGSGLHSVFHRPLVAGLVLAALVLLIAAPAAQAAGDVGVPEARANMLEAIFFYVFSAAALISGLMICIGKNVVRMAVWLFFVLGSVALLYFLLGANFLAAIQFIVYAGGTLILLIFGVMLTNKSPWFKLNIQRREIAAAGVVAMVTLLLLVTMAVTTHWPAEVAEAEGISVARIGQSLLTTYLVPFEVASVMLLAVMIGAAYLARQEN